ncbi:MAG: methyltransferase [Candidatus Methanomethylicaceae archaeon]
MPYDRGAKPHLKDGGSLILVLRKGVNAIPRKMMEVFGNVELVSRKSGYKVFQSRRSANNIN